MKYELYNPNGYKICYRENNKRLHVYIITNDRWYANWRKNYCEKNPQYKGHHLIKNAEWFVCPISNEEIKNGIWKDCRD